MFYIKMGAGFIGAHFLLRVVSLTDASYQNFGMFLESPFIQ
jgi:hypothetical protein